MTIRKWGWTSALVASAFMATACPDSKDDSSLPADSGIPPDAGQLALILNPVPSARSLDEGSTFTFQATLNRAPDADIEVTASSNDESALTVAPATATLNASNFDMPITITVTAPQDDDATNETVTITVAATSLGEQTFEVTVRDDDTQRLIVASTRVTVMEGGMETVAVSLNAQPDSDYEVMVANDNPTKIGASPTTLTFTSANWNMPQDLTVSGTDDNDIAEERGTLTLSGDGVDNALIDVTVRDDDMLAVNGAPMNVTVVEGSTTSFSISLASAPTMPVSISIDSDDNAIARATPARLSFTPQNFDQPQEVTITGVQDNNVADDTTTMRINGAGPEVSFTVNVTDDDTQALVVAPATLTIAEGGAAASGMIAVRLAFQPSADVQVTRPPPTRWPPR